MAAQSDDQPKTPNLRPAIELLAWLTVCYAAALAAFVGTSPDVWFWYVLQLRPSWGPPTFAFTPINTVVYGCMGVAVWQAAREPSDVSKRNTLTLFFIQLVLGAIWPWIFFAWHRTMLAADFGFALLIVLIATTVLFWKTRPSAGRLILPMIAWVGYFTFVQLTVYRLNR